MNWLRRLLANAWTRDRGQVRRVVVVVLEGLKPALIDYYLEQGLLHNLALLSDVGTRILLRDLEIDLAEPLASAGVKNRLRTRVLRAMSIRNPPDLNAICAADRLQQERMITALSRARGGLVVAVFDMPLQLARLFGPDPTDDQRQITRDVYARMDEIVGKAFSFVDAATVLFVVVSRCDDGPTADRPSAGLLFASCPAERLGSAEVRLPSAVLHLLGVGECHE
jgi:hypothetical protein